MENYLKLCPFCKAQLEPFGHDIDKHTKPHSIIEVFRHPYNDDPENEYPNNCPLSHLVFSDYKWNTRPIEDEIEEKLGYSQQDNVKLRREIEQLKSEVKVNDEMFTDLENELLEEDATISKLSVALHDMLMLIEEHGSPTMKAHATRISEARKILWDIQND